MSFRLRVYLSGVLCLALSSPCLRSATAETALKDAWDSAATFRPNEAIVDFSLAQKKGGPARELALGRATALIGVQPKTASNIEEAAQICNDLVRENAGDETGVLATYLLARIEQFHRHPANLEKAEEIYRGLIQNHPQFAISQISASKLAVVLLFAKKSDQAGLKKSLAELEGIASKLTVSSARRDTFLVMGNACILFDLGDDKALKYLMAAEAEKMSSAKLQGDLLVQIGSTAQKLGRKDLAIQYYSKFLTDYKRDTRSYVVRQRMEALKSGS